MENKYVFHINKWWWGNSIKMITPDAIAALDIQFDNSFPNSAFITGLSVHEDYRNQGLGTKILSDAERFCSGYGKKNIFLSVEKGSSHLKKWYKKKGYKPVTYSKHYIKMEKKLEDA